MSFNNDFKGPSNGVPEKVEGSDKNGRLYDKAGKVRKIRHDNKETDGEGKIIAIKNTYI